MVTPAAPLDVEDAVGLLAAAFRDDGVMGAFVADEAAVRTRRLEHLFRVIVRAGLEHGAVPAYLAASSERSAALYRRFGFTTMRVVEGFPGAVRPIAMWRAGASAERTRSAVPCEETGAAHEAVRARTAGKVLVQVAGEAAEGAE